MRIKLAVASTIVFVLSTGVFCLRAQQKPSARNRVAAARKGVEETMQRSIAAAKAKDAKAAAAIYTDDAILMPPGQGPVKGPDAILAFFRKLHGGDGVLLDQQVETLDLSLLSDDVAVELSTFRGSFTQPGKPNGYYSGRGMIIYKRQPDGSWKMYRDMWDLAP